MKRSELEKLIKESITELMTETYIKDESNTHYYKLFYKRVLKEYIKTHPKYETSHIDALEYGFNNGWNECAELNHTINDKNRKNK